MTLQRIVLNDSAGQKFSTIIDGRRIEFSFRYNTLIERFRFDISINGTIILQGRTLIEDVDLLKVYERLFNIGNLFCVDIDGKNREPNLTNISNGNVRIFLNVG